MEIRTERLVLRDWRDDAAEPHWAMSRDAAVSVANPVRRHRQRLVVGLENHALTFEGSHDSPSSTEGRIPVPATRREDARLLELTAVPFEEGFLLDRVGTRMPWPVHGKDFVAATRATTASKDTETCIDHVLEEKRIEFS